MSDRIDHRAEAVGLVSEANKVLSVDQPLTTEAAHLAAVAQVHATLALVEQQRIANLIALSEPRELPNGGTVWNTAIYSDAMPGALDPDIAAALGLEAPNA